MKRLILLLGVAAPLFAVNPVATQIGTPSAFNGSLYDSDATITFSASGAYNRMELMYSPTQHCAGVAPATYLAAGGLIQPPDNQGSFFNISFNTINFGGLSYGTTYHVCIGLSNDGGSTWNNANEYDVTTLAKQDHTVQPAKRFNSELPDMTGATTVTVSSDCHDANDLINDAIDRQGTTPTKIIFPTGNSCNPPVAFSLYHQFNFQHYAQDLITFNDTEITTGSPGLFAFSSGIVSAMTNGDLVTFADHYGGEGSIDIGTSCPNSIGMNDGGHFYITKVDSTHIKLSCEGIDGNPLATFITVNSAAHTTHGYQFVPWHKVTNQTCLSTTGRKPCTYWARNLKWIILESANAETVKMPPYGVRTDPSYFTAGLGSTIVDPVINAGGTSSTNAAWIFGDVDGNDHTMVGNIMVRGLEFTFENDPSDNEYCNIFMAQPFVGPVVFAQNYFHGGGTPQRWGGPSCSSFQFQGTNFSFRDNYIDNMTHWSSSTTEGSSATMSKGPGPIEYWNNHTEGVGVAIHFDDADGYASTGMFLRGDNYVARNFFYSPTKYMHGSPDSDGFYYGQRQPLEFKAGYRNQVIGNYIKYVWAEVTPASVGVAATSVNGIGITDLDISNNWFDHGPGVTNFSSNTNGGDPQTVPPNRVTIRNNLATDISAAWAVTGGFGFTSKGWFIEGPLGGCCNTADHNTLVNNDGAQPVMSVLFNTSSSDTAFVNNILYFRSAQRGLADSGTVGTNNACSGLLANALATCRLPSNVFQGNFFGSQDASQANINTWWPGSVNYVASNPADQTVIKYINASQQNYALDYNSPYNSSSATLSTDHRDVGVDMSELTNNMGVTKITSITGISSTAAQINYYNPDGMACYVAVLTHAWPITGSDTPLQFVDLAPAQGSRLITLTGLSGGTFYYPRLECATYQDTAQFKTAPASATVLLSTISGCGSAGTGGTDTTCLQGAFNTTAGASQILEIPPATSGFYNTGHLTCPNGLNVLLDAGTHIKAVTGIASGDAIIDCDNASNLTFNGTPGSSSIEGRKAEYTSGESRHCIRFGGSTDVLFQGISCNESGGDGIYIGEGSRGYALRVEVANAVFNHNSRNGITIISCDTCNIHDTTSSNTIGENGAASAGPWAGIDIEPNNDGSNPWSLDRLVNITLTNLTLTGNGLPTDHGASNGNGFTCHLDLLTAANSPANTSISGSNITSANNVNSGFHVTNEHDVTGNTGPGKAGHIALTSSHSTNNGMYGTRAFFYDAGGPVFSYTFSVNTNNNVLGTTIDDADMSVERGGGAVNPMGGIQFTGDSIISTNGNLQYYFDVEDFSSVGLSNIVIGTFGTLSGRTGSTNGLLNGSGVASVSIP